MEKFPGCGQREIGQREQGQRDTALLSLKTEERAMNPTVQAVWKGQGAEFPLEPPERSTTLLTLGFQPSPTHARLPTYRTAR